MSEVPQLAQGVIPRRRLLEMLGNLKPLTVVSAPAGYGKSVLVESWVAGHAGDVTLVRSALEEEDSLREHVWPSLFDAFRRAGLVLDGDVAARLQGGDRRGVSAVAAAIAAHGRRLVWILDCGEFALSAQAGRDLDRLIRASGETLAVLLLTRQDPPLPLHRLRLEGALREVRAADLAFTAGEVAALMDREGVELRPQQVSDLRTRTGGWPAGLRFAAMSLRERRDVGAAIADFRGDTGNVADYLMGEVLQRQPPERQEFLLRSCIADELAPGLVEALTGQHCDVQVLRTMADGDCFVERIPGQHERFRYHALFRQFLRAQLTFDKLALADSLHKVAARWLAEDGQWLPAVRHASAGSDWPMAAHVLVDSLGFVHLLTGHRSRMLKALFQQLPPDLDGPEPALARAAMSLADLDAATASNHLEEARASLGRESAAVVTPSCAVTVAVLTALQKSLELDTRASLDIALDTVLSAEQTLRLLSEPEPSMMAPNLAAVVAGCKGRVLFTRGELTEAGQAFREGTRAAEAARLDVLAGELKGMSALVEAVAGRLRRATATASQATPPLAADTGSARTTSEAALLALAWVRVDEAEPAVAHELVAQARTQLLSYDSHLLAAVSTLLRARLLGDQGDPGVALAELRVALAELGVPRVTDSDLSPVDAGTLRSWPARTLLLQQAEALTLLGRPGDASALVDEAAQAREPRELDTELALQQALLANQDPDRDLTRLAATGHARHHDETPLSLQVTRWLLLADGSVTDGDPTAGAGYLGQALRLAAPENLRRPILQASDGVQELLAVSGLGSRNRWLSPSADTALSLQGGFHIPEQRSGPYRDEPEAPSPVVLPLTKKESEVLGYLAKLLTTDEIAAEMLVSVNTVRSHVRSILRKLGVSRRNAAVRRAWELELLPPDSAA